MERFIILRKHMLVKSYTVIKDDVTRAQLGEFIQKLPESDLPQYKFIRGNFISPTITYDAKSFDEVIVHDEVKEPKDNNVAQRIFAKYTQQGSIFENNQGAV